MHFYHAPKTCSQAAHILLHETKIPFESHKVDVFTHTMEDGKDYYRINPNGYVPMLIFNDGRTLTENLAILDWIASQKTALVPQGDWARTQQLQLMAFLSTEIHKPFLSLFFSESETEKQYLLDILPKRFQWLRNKMQGDFLFGNQFTAADALLYSMIRWTAMVELDVPASFQSFIHLIEERDSVKKVLALEDAEPLTLTLHKASLC